MGQAIVRSNPTLGALTRADKGRLALFAKTVGKDLLPSEINEAIDWCEVYRANPFTRDIYFFVFDANNSEKRRLAPVLAIGLYRKIAARTGNYRPDENPPVFTYDEAAKGPANPRGIVDCTVTVYQFSHGAWHPVRERLRWDERAPIVVEGTGGTKWEDTGEVYPPGHNKAGKPKFKKVAVGERVECLDPGKRNWHTMPETMLSKCVEAAAIRKGWPEDTAGSYVDGELDANTIELTASEIIHETETAAKLSLAGGVDALTIAWEDGKPLERVPMGTFADRVLSWASDEELSATELRIFWNRNLPARIEFKAKHGGDYLELQKRFEALTEKREAAE